MMSARIIFLPPIILIGVLLCVGGYFLVKIIKNNKKNSAQLDIFEDSEEKE